jgi:hypothetical protein
MNAYAITCKNKDQGLNTIQEILKNNFYQQQIIRSTPKRNLIPRRTQKTQKTKWATFTYHGPEKRTITKLLKNTDIGIAFKTTNTIKMPKTQRTNKRRIISKWIILSKIY